MSHSPAIEPLGSRGSYSVTLPCEPEKFSEFISGLLGKPQTITRQVGGPFEVKRRDLSDLYLLVEQRIASQNKASLVQFIVKVVYDDGSSVQLNSFQAFNSYNEVKPLRSRAVHLSWTYLVQFNNKPFPEKQQIDLSLVLSKHRQFEIDEEIVNVAVGRLSPGVMQLRVSHTDRSWGADLEALLSGRLEQLKRRLTSTQQFVQRRAGWFGFGTATSVTALLLFGLYQSSNAVKATHLKVLQELSASTATVESLAKQIDYLATLIANGFGGRSLVTLIMALGAIVIGIVAGVVVVTWAEQERPSTILLTRRDEEQYETDPQRRAFKYFILSLAGSLAVGVAGNYIFFMISKYIAL